MFLLLRQGVDTAPGELCFVIYPAEAEQIEESKRDFVSGFRFRQYTDPVVSHLISLCYEPTKYHSPGHNFELLQLRVGVKG